MISQRTDEDGVWWWPIEDTRCWEYLHRWIDVPELVMNNITVKNVAVQAGGNCGLYVKRYAKEFKTVYTFEPVSELFNCLVRNINESNVIKIQACLGDSHRLVSMNPHEGGDIGGGFVNNDDIGTIPVLMIDDLNLPVCNLIHLDIEGYEFYALNGAKDTITRCKPVIAIENCEKWLVRYGSSLEQIEKFLENLGYIYKTSARGDRVYIHSG
jgi:FkbM family methyltransferase